MAARVRRWGHREYFALPACHAPCLSSKQSQKRHYCQTCVCSSQGLGGQMDRFLLRPCAVLVAAALAQLCLSVKGVAQQPDSQLVTLQPDPASDVLPFYRDWTKRDEPALSEPALSREQTIEHLRAAIKYVFVIFQENESFDHYFGTFPGANGIYSDGQHPRTPKDTPGATQTYQNIVSGETVTVEPFLIGPDQNANVLDSVDHSHVGMAGKMHVSNNTAAMDQFAFAEYTHYGSKCPSEKKLNPLNHL
jgi:phospholipase C